MKKIQEWIRFDKPYFNSEWSAMGYNTNPFFNESATLWSNTLCNEINKISAQIHNSTLLGGADTIETHEENMIFFSGMEFFNSTTNQIGTRYQVVINNGLSINEILVYKKHFYVDTTNFKQIGKADLRKTVGKIIVINRE